MVFLDSNVFLDAFLQRDHARKDCFAILNLGARNELEIFTSSSCLLQVMYFLKKDKMSNKNIIGLMTNILSFCNILCNTNHTFIESLSKNFKDLEDAVQYQTALDKVGMEYFITSNVKDFKFMNHILPVLTPKEFIHLSQNN